MSRILFRDLVNTNIPLSIPNSGRLRPALNRKILDVALLRLWFRSIVADQIRPKSGRYPGIFVFTKSLKTVTVLAVAAAVAMPAGGAFAADAAKEVIKIAVDPCTQPLAEDLAYAFNTRTKTKFQITQGKCKVGVDAARNEEATMGMSTQNITELEPGLTKTVIAKAPIVFIVNKNNAVNGLTSKQLYGILNGDITNWKEVGGKDEHIHNVMLEPCVKETVARQVLDAPGYPDIKMLVPDVKFNAVKDTNKSVERNDGAIGQQIYGYESKNVKVLTIDGLLPTAGVVPAKYRMYEDYNIITKGEPKGVTAEFIKFALSDEGQKIAENLKHIPVR